METIAEILIILFIIGVNLFLGGRRKTKRENENETEAEGEEPGSQGSGMEELRERVRRIKANAYWQQFREQIVPPEESPVVYMNDEDEEEEDSGQEKEDIYSPPPQADEEEEETQYAPPKPIWEIMEEREREAAKIVAVEEAVEEKQFLSFGKDDLQRGIVMAEILAPCLAKREGRIHRI